MTDRLEYHREYSRLTRCGIRGTERRRRIAEWRVRQDREMRLGTIWDGPWSPQSTWPSVEEALVQVFGPRGITADLFAEARLLESLDTRQVQRELWTRIRAGKPEVKVMAAGAGGGL